MIETTKSTKILVKRVLKLWFTVLMIPISKTIRG